MNFESQQIRHAALELLNLGQSISRKQGGFLGQLAAQPEPVSPKQRKWLDDLLAAAGFDAVEDTIVRLPRGWRTMVFVTADWDDDEDRYHVILARATASPHMDSLRSFPLNDQGKQEAIDWARAYVARTRGCVFGGPEE